MSGSDAFLAGVIIALLTAVGLACAAGINAARETLSHACGECDHVGECGDYECRPGVDGWQLKAGAR